MRRFARWLPTILVLLAFQGVTKADDEAPARVEGTWKKTQVFKDGATLSWTFRFKQDGGKVTGIYVAGTHQSDIKGGKVEGDQISFWTELEIGGKVYRSEWSGTVEKDTIKGIQETRIDGGPKRSGPWLTERISDEGPK